MTRYHFQGKQMLLVKDIPFSNCREGLSQHLGSQLLHVPFFLLLEKAKLRYVKNLGHIFYDVEHSYHFLLSFLIIMT